MRVRWGTLPADTYAQTVGEVMRRKGGRVLWVGVGGFVVAWRRNA